jgi:hypothetical protein
MKPPEKKKTRKHGKHLRVPVLEQEEEAIKQRAATAGLSVSSYLRKIALDYPIYNILDYQAVDTLAKVNGDCGRLGGLLKLWLSDDKKLVQFEPLHLQHAIVGALQKISQNQEELRRIILTIVKQ